MSMIDRFICRREGHDPTVRVTNLAPSWAYSVVTSYITTCRRCGKAIEVQATGRAEAS
jgi:hypothetical protein